MLRTAPVVDPIMRHEDAAPVPTPSDSVIAQRIAFAPLLFQAARCARDMGVLAEVERGGTRGVSPREVASATALSLYAVRLLLEASLSLELVSLTGDRYAITGAGLVLLHDERARVNLDFSHDVCYRGAYHLEEALRDGRPAGLGTLGPWSTIYEGVPELDERARDSWYAFDHHYSDGVFPRAVRWLAGRGVRRVLDVGGNTGRFAVLAARHMHVTMLDHPGQLAIARKNAEAAGVSDMIATHPIDLLDHGQPFPTGHDAVWMSQVLDCFGEDDVVDLLKRARAALTAEGRVYVVECYWDRQPTEAARVSLHGLSLYFASIANGTSRMYHSDDLRRCAAEAGLELDEDRTLGPWHTLFVLRP
jgi:SAM-dependent methyltransferase